MVAFFFHPSYFIKVLTALLILTFKITASDQPPKENLNVYLLIGGETMAGKIPYPEEEYKVIPRCYLLNEKGEWEPARGPFNRYSSIKGEEPSMLGPGLGFVKTMLEKDPEMSIGLVVNAGKGTTKYVEHWRYKDDVYRRARKRIRQAQKSGTIKGVLWHQDSNRIDSSLSYIKDLISNLRIDLNLLELPFIVGGIPGKDVKLIPSKEKYPLFAEESGPPQIYDSKYRSLIKDVHATGYARGDDLSLDVKGMETFGNRYAEEMLRVQRDMKSKRTSSQNPPQWPIIDAHIHAQHSKPGGLDVVAKWMKHHGIEKCISKPLTQSRAKTPEEREIMLNNFDKYKGQIYRFCIIEPHEVNTIEEAVKILEKEKAEGAIGFGEHYGRNLMFDDPKNMRLYAACEKVGLPIHFHIDNNKNMDEKGLPHLENALKTFPKCKFIAHAQFWLHLPDGTVDRLLSQYPNLYAEPSGLRMAAVLNRDRAYTRKFLIKHADRIIFATDAGWWSFVLGKLGREPIFDLMEQLDLPPSVKKKIYRDNAINLFGWEKKVTKAKEVDLNP